MGTIEKCTCYKGAIENGTLADLLPDIENFILQWWQMGSNLWKNTNDVYTTLAKKVVTAEIFMRLIRSAIV